jgi:hypothetical protein
VCPIGPLTYDLTKSVISLIYGRGAMTKARAAASLLTNIVKVASNH